MCCCLCCWCCTVFTFDLFQGAPIDQYIGGGSKFTIIPPPRFCGSCASECDSAPSAGRSLTQSRQHIPTTPNTRQTLTLPSGLPHHHYVPSVVNRWAVMDFHRSRSCTTLIQSLYDIPVHSSMLSVHIVLGLPRPLLPFIFPYNSNRCTPFPLIISPKYWHFLFW